MSGMPPPRAPPRRPRRCLAPGTIPSAAAVRGIIPLRPCRGPIASTPGLLPEGIRPDEEGYPSTVRRGDRALLVRQHVHHAQHQEGPARRALLAVPPVLHRQA